MMCQLTKKKEPTNLFEIGHNASSARHAHEQRLLHEAEMNKQVMLADQAQNPNHQNVYQLYSKWKLGSYGNDNGKGPFEKLQQAVDAYNRMMGVEVEGRQCCSGIMLVKDKLVKHQIVILRKLNHQEKRKITSANSIPMILAICTSIVRRAHQHAQQSRDVVFIDATSTFDRQNTSIFILSTVTP